MSRFDELRSENLEEEISEVRCLGSAERGEMARIGDFPRCRYVGGRVVIVAV